MIDITKEKQVVSVTEASKMLDVHPSTIRRAIKRGHLKAFKLSPKGGRFKIRIDELTKVFNKQMPINPKAK